MSDAAISPVIAAPERAPCEAAGLVDRSSRLAPRASRLAPRASRLAPRVVRLALGQGGDMRGGVGSEALPLI